MEINMTEQEIIKCITHPDYYISNHCKIEVTGKGLMPFKLYNYQKQALKSYIDSDSVFILKSRQMGFTTLAAAYSLWYSLRQGNNVLFLSKKEEDAMDILRKVKIMYENLPKELKVEIISSNATTLEFANKNRIQSLPATERSGAGKTASLIIMDEFSAFPSAKGEIAGENVWTSIYPTLSTGGRVIVQSTPKGMGNKFYNLWAGNNGFAKYKFLWTDHPVFGKDLYDREIVDKYGAFGSPWADKMMANMTPDGWAKEFNGDFVTSGRPVFDWDSLKQYEVNEVDELYTNHYACGVDLASGSSKDFHVAQFLCAETGKQVESYRSQEPIDIFAQKVIEKCRKYNDALLAFENNSGYGLAFMKGVTNYQNLYYQKKFDKRTEKRTNTLGWNTNVKTKQIMITDMNLALIKGDTKITDKKTIDECKTYQYDDNDKMNAMSGFNDDCVTSYAIALQAIKSMNIEQEEYEMKPMKLGVNAPLLDANGNVVIGEIIYNKISTNNWKLV